MADIKKFKHFQVHPGEITTVRFTAPRLTGDILLEGVRNDLIDFVSSGPANKLLLDFSEVTYFSSMLINCLLQVRQSVTKENAGQMKLCNMRGSVAQSYQSLGLEKVLPLYETAAEAEAAFDS